MSGSSSPINGGYEPSIRLTVRKDLFPNVLPETESEVTDPMTLQDEDISCVKLETDFEQSIDEIANQKLLVANGSLMSSTQTRHRKHKQSRHDLIANGFLSSERKLRKRSPGGSKRRSLASRALPLRVKGGKNLNLVSSSENQEEEDDETEKDSDTDSSDDEVLKCSVKLPLVNLPRPSGKPFSHELSQLSSKKSKSKTNSKEKRTTVIPCSGKPRSMLGICSSRSKKKSKKSECTATYRSQIVDTNTKIKIKIRRTSIREVITPTATSVADIGQRKSKKKRAASPVPSESSGEEYDPSRGDTPAAMSMAAPKPRHPPPKSRKPNHSKSKGKSEKTEKSRISEANTKDTGPQSPWAQTMPEEILLKIFEYVTAQGTLPSVIRLGKVCKLWHSVSCHPELWKNVDLAQYTTDKCKTDYKLVWLLENRLSQCQVLNIAHWKVCNVTWVLACVVDYCPSLIDLSVAGWSRLTPDQLYDLVQGLPNLQRLDLSLTSETGGSSTCLSAISVARLMEEFGSRFTHLTLANNKFTALQQILLSIASHSPNLEVLDISGARATSHPAVVPLEALQRGCPKLRVFRAANAQLVLANATTAQQMESCGWTQLEELSIAGEAATERVAVGEYRLGDEALARLVRAATRLRLLDLRGLQRLTDSGLVRVPAWDLQHLFLGGCNVTRQTNACLELICEKWSHSLMELDLSWASAARAIDAAVTALADAPAKNLRILNLCGSSVSLEPIKKVLMKCTNIESLNLSSCRALPRGMKRLYTGKELEDLKDSLDPTKAKAKDKDDDDEDEKSEKSDVGSKSEAENEAPKPDVSTSTGPQVGSKPQDKSSSPVFQEPKSVPESVANLLENALSTEIQTKISLDSKIFEISANQDTVESATLIPEGNRSSRDATPKLLSPIVQSKPDSSSTPRSDPGRTELGSPLVANYSPVSKPDSQVQNSPDVLYESTRNSNSWSLGQFTKSTPTHKSEVSPLNRLENPNKVKHGQIIEQCSPTTSLENKPSPETLNVKQDIKNPNSWNYGSYSPMPRQDNQFSSQRSPYSAQPSPAQPSPYSKQQQSPYSKQQPSPYSKQQPSPYSKQQPSPYSTQPSPYSSQPSPYSAQPSPDTSQMVKPDIQKTSNWNTGSYSPMPKHHAPFSPRTSTHPSPDPGLSVKDNLRNNPNKTPDQFSPLSRHDRLHNSPYSPKPSVDNTSYSNKKSPGMGNYNPETAQSSRSVISGRLHDVYGRPLAKAPELIQNVPANDISSGWGIDKFGQMVGSGLETLSWGATPFGPELVPTPTVPHAPAPPSHVWPSMHCYDTSARRHNEDLSDPWSLGQFREEPPNRLHNSYLDHNVSLESLSDIGLHAPASLGSHAGSSASFLDDGFAEPSRAD